MKLRNQASGAPEPSMINYYRASKKAESAIQSMKNEIEGAIDRDGAFLEREACTPDSCTMQKSPANRTRPPREEFRAAGLARGELD